MQKINIESKEDLEKWLYAIMKGDSVEIGDIKPIPFALHFKGDRFQVKDGYISADFADTLSVFKREYRNFLATATGKNKAKDVEILFKIEDGSVILDFLNDLPKELWKLGDKMTGNQVTIVAVLAIMGYFADSSWEKYLEAQKQKASTELAGQSLQVATSAIEKLASNKKLETAKNKPINLALKSLQDGESLEIGDSTNIQKYTKEDIVKFPYDDDAEEAPITLEEKFVITGFEKKAYGWELHLKAVSKDVKPRTFWALSKVAPAENITLFQAADKNEEKQLSVTMIKNRDKIKEAYITAVK